ncbi:MAG: M20 family metallopeptidase, partial [Bacteroidota bacterium]
QKFVEACLDAIGVKDHVRMADTGVVAMIKGRNPDSRVLALRADMDALPIHEENQVEYRSVRDGVMHACGHDVHTASLLGAAAILNELRGRFEGTVKLIFQPGEEKIPGGASKMIKEGVLDKPAPASVIGQHVMPQLPAGKIGFRKGLYMASADELYLTIHGKGGHGAMPHTVIDPIMISAQVLVALQQVVSRFAKPSIPSVLSFGKVIANGATNVIPDKVYLEGTFRTFDENWRSEAHMRMKKLVEDLVSGMGGRCEFEIRRGYPFLINDEALTDRSRSWAEEYVGAENVQDLDLWMAAEDFAYYSQVAPSCFYRLGVRNESKGIISSVHTPTFDVDESALELGAGLMAWLAVKELEAKFLVHD